MLKKLANIGLIVSLLLFSACATRAPQPLATNTLEISAEDDIATIKDKRAK